MSKREPSRKAAPDSARERLLDRFRRWLRYQATCERGLARASNLLEAQRRQPERT